MALFARELRTKRGLIVITNAVTTAAEAPDNTDATIITTGGVLRRSTLGSVGDVAVQTLVGLRADIAFIATAGVVDGLSYPAVEEASVKKAMIASSSEVILLADHTKLDQVALALFAPLTAINRIITTGYPSPELAEALDAASIDLIVVPYVAEDRREEP